MIGLTQFPPPFSPHRCEPLCVYLISVHTHTHTHPGGRRGAGGVAELLAKVNTKARTQNYQMRPRVL